MWYELASWLVFLAVGFLLLVVLGPWQDQWSRWWREKSLLWRFRRADKLKKRALEETLKGIDKLGS